ISQESKMKPWLAILSVPLLLCAGNALAASPHVHAGHAGPATPVASDAEHVRWAPDAPLRAGMRRMRDAVSGLGHLEEGHLDEDQVLRLTNEVTDAAAFMFDNCELAAEPDIALHGMLARLMAGAQGLRRDPADAAPVASMR